MLYPSRTARLALRAWREEDQPAFAAMNADERVMEYFPATLTAEESADLLDRIRDEFSTEGFGPYAVERLSDGELLGFTGLHRVTFSGGLEGQVEILWRLRHDADSVGMEGTAKIWYIGRFLDGFIFDTNIDEVKQIIYGEVRKTGSAHSYDVQNPDLITAFYYIVPHLKYGQWATLVTTSTNAYGTTGKSGGSSTSTSSNGYTSSYYDYLNYLNYSQMYYGNNGYYGGYYNDYYGYGGLGNYGYYGGYYGGYGGNYDSGETVTTTEVYTDIPSFSPLIFQIYIEPDGE